MPSEIPAALLNESNNAVLAYLAVKSAHSDIATELEAAVKPLGGAQLYCPDWQSYRYVTASTGGIVFAFAEGMNRIAFRLEDSMRRRALKSGAVALAECGPEWAAFTLFRSDWPAVDTAFWALKAYDFARRPAS